MVLAMISRVSLGHTGRMLRPPKGMSFAFGLVILAGLVRTFGRDFPPEPIRYFGAQLVRRAVAAKDKADDAGRLTGPLTNYLASLAPAGLSPLKKPTRKEPRDPSML